MDWLSALIGAAGSIFGGVLGSQGSQQASQEQIDALKTAISQEQTNLGSAVAGEKAATGSAVNAERAGTAAAIKQQTNATRAAVGDIRNGVATGADAINGATGHGVNALRGGLKTATTDLTPWMAAGKNALAQYQGELGLSKTGAGGTPFKSQFQETPGYKFQEQQGQKAAVSNLRALGLGGSGAALKTLSRFNSNLADTTYQQYLDRVGGVANSGQSAASTLGGYATNEGASEANLRADQGSELAQLYGNGGAQEANATMGGAQNIGGWDYGGGANVGSTIQHGADEATGAYTGIGEQIAQSEAGVGTAAASGTAGSTNSWLTALGNGMNNIGKTLGSSSWDFLPKTAAA